MLKRRKKVLSGQKQKRPRVSMFTSTDDSTLPTEKEASMGSVSSAGVDGKKYDSKSGIRFSIYFKNWKVGPKYALKKAIGYGSYGCVCLATTQSGERVAIKRITRIFSNKIDVRRTLREIRILAHLNKSHLNFNSKILSHGHPNIMKLLDLKYTLNDSTQLLKDIYVVSPFMDMDMESLINDKTQWLTSEHTRIFLRQILHMVYIIQPILQSLTDSCLFIFFIIDIFFNNIGGVKYMHSADILHRDLKPANILLNTDCELQIADFGLARVIDPTQPMVVSPKSLNEHIKTPVIRRQYSTHVVTRWYRAPELILGLLSNVREKSYSSAVDVWSIGCIFAEMLSMEESMRDSSPSEYNDNNRRSPLFRGSSSQDQLRVICSILGRPTNDEITRLCRETSAGVRQYLLSIHPNVSQDLSKRFPGADKDALELLRRMIMFDPTQRISIDDALNHAYIKTIDTNIITRAVPNRTCPPLQLFEGHDENISDLNEALKKEIDQFINKH